MPGHPTRPLVDPFTGRTVGIDVEMLPIISSLWALGIETLECCQGDPGGLPAAVCFPVVGRVDEWGLLRGRFRKSRQWAARLAVMLAGVAPHDRWRRWGWDVEEWEQSTAVVLPNEDLQRFAAQLHRLQCVAAGQLTLGDIAGAAV
jgi:hypothetical protein